MENQQPLPGYSFFLKESWKEYKARTATYLFIVALPLAVSLFFNGAREVAEMMFPSASGFPRIDLSNFFFSALASGWSGASLFFAVKERKERISSREAFRKGWPKILPFIWTAFLVAAAAVGGIILFLIPGIIFLIWFSFSTCIVVAEDKSGIPAMKRSKHLVEGRWWNVFSKIIMFGLAVILFIFAAGIGIFLLSGQWMPDWLSEIISFLIAPFSAIYSFLIYEKLRDLSTNH